jgi:peptidoglycan hydrolase-like protein with peptidoglycan-binding domain
MTSGRLTFVISLIQEDGMKAKPAVSLALAGALVFGGGSMATMELFTAQVASASTAAVTLPGWPMLDQGANSAWPKVTVRSLQYLLNAHGARLVVDGVFGPLTNGAVRTFQAAHGLPVTGVVDGRTWPALIITVSRGSVGSAVKAAQDQLNFRNLRGTGLLHVDGIFGPITQRSVLSFQKGVGLVPDGTVGPLTWRALISEFMSG